MASGTIKQPAGIRVLGNTNSSTVSVMNDQSKAIGEITLTKGVWLLIVCADWAANGTGYRQLSLANSLNPGRQNTTTTMAVTEGSKQTYQQLVYFLTVSQTSTIEYYGRQTSGSTLSVYPYAHAILLAAA